MTSNWTNAIPIPTQLQEKLKEAYHKYGSVNASLFAKTEMVVQSLTVAGWTERDRVYAPVIQQYANEGPTAFQVLNGQQGVGKSFFLRCLARALSLLFSDMHLLPVYFTYRAADTIQLPSELIHIALAQAGHSDFVDLVPSYSPANLGSIMRFIELKNLRIVLFLDEIQDVVKLPDVARVTQINKQLYSLQQWFARGIMTIVAGSSLFVPALFQKNLPASQHGIFPGYQGWQYTQWDSLTSVQCYPIITREDFEQACHCLVNPQTADYDSATWSLNFSSALGGDIEMTEAGGEQGKADSDRQEGLEISDALLDVLFTMTGGLLRRLNAQIIKLPRTASALGMPSLEERKESIRKEVQETQRTMAANPNLLDIYERLFDSLTPLLPDRLEDGDLFDLPLASPLGGIDTFTFFELADRNLIRLDQSAEGNIIGIGYPRPSIIYAMLQRKNLPKSDVSIADLWVARFVLDTLGISMEHIVLKALAGKTLHHPAGHVLSVASYQGRYLSTDVVQTGPTMMQKALDHLKVEAKGILVLCRNQGEIDAYETRIAQHNRRAKHLAKVAGLCVIDAVKGEVLRTYPHSLKGGGGDAVLVDSYCDILQIKMGGSKLGVGDILKRLKDTKEAMELLAEVHWPHATVPYRLHVLTTRELSDQVRRDLEKEAIVWGPEILGGIWQRAIREMVEKLNLAAYLG
ncbi:hypothetical protein HK097_007261 [Rhizophlyctis rosea]|uniref:Uncharacterized protein n=1 Tax=Rhizophlyctis rosea TaxID=64517 RepID=A0AAD5SDB2_9FUNG|nr:hypothetical protein HK097_007261 [Rhizophlyctis rosea]